MAVRLSFCLLAALVLAGCSSSDAHRSVLYEGVSFGVSQSVHHVGDAEAAKAAREALRSWRRQLKIRARSAPAEAFENATPAAIRSSVAAEARRYHFRVLSLRLLRPRQLAPEVVVETRDYTALARAVPAIEARLDPHRGTQDAQGWAYEGFYFQADDERRVPFLAIFNFWRGRNGGGGQFARSDRLFPFAHG